MAISRREFLLGGAAAAGGFALLRGRGIPAALADAPRPARQLVVVFVGGGWDVSVALDPKPGSSLVDGAPGDVRSIGGIPILSHASRPSVDAFFQAWGASSVVVNGITVRSIAHPECWKHVLTGTSSEA